MDLKDVQPYIEDKVCMVTGGGGSIGSEIVRSLSKLNAEKIVIVDIYENGANRRNFNRHLVADFTFYTVRTVFVYIDNYDFFRIEF